MLSLAIYGLLVGFYLWSGDSRTPLREACIAIVLSGLYLVIHLWVPPFPVRTTVYTGQLYGLVPMISLGLILLPHFNTSSPEVVSRFIGWACLILVTVILLVFKALVW